MERERKRIRPICPQCGSTDIGHRWVTKPGKREGVTFQEFADKLIEDKRLPMSGGPHVDITPLQLKDISQLVIECESCGYTNVFDITHEGK